MRQLATIAQSLDNGLAADAGLLRNEQRLLKEWLELKKRLQDDNNSD